MKKLLFSTGDTPAAILLRLTIGLVVLAHGCQNMLGWFGGQGFSATMQFLTDVMQLPWLIGFLVIAIQFFGSLFLLAGFLTRPAAFGMFVIFTGMILTSHLDHGFFMNWFGTQKGEGYEYHILVLGMCAALMISGGGAWSVDRLVSRIANSEQTYFEEV